VKRCRGPDDKLYTAPEVAPENDPDDMTCIALAQVLSNDCSRDGHPRCPQHDTMTLTWDSSYTLFAAYHDLGRDGSLRVRKAVCDDAKEANAPLAAELACKAAPSVTGTDARAAGAAHAASPR
jgi:hypothetical protein